MNGNGEYVGGKLLVVVDMQNDFITGTLGTPEAESIVERVCKKIEEWDGDVIYTQDGHETEYAATREGQKIPEHCIVGTEGWKIHRRVFYYMLKRNDITVFHKARFADTRLQKWIYAHAMRWNGKLYENIELVGLCTDICVLANALLLNASWPGMRISVDAQCCAGTTPEKHEKALDIMEGCLIEVVNREPREEEEE